MSTQRVFWHRGDQSKDHEVGIYRTWTGKSDVGRFEIYQGRPSDGTEFVYELRRPDGTRERFRLIAEAKKAALA